MRLIKFVSVLVVCHSLGACNPGSQENVDKNTRLNDSSLVEPAMVGGQSAPQVASPERLVFFDPETGEFTDKPSNGQPQPQVAPAEVPAADVMVEVVAPDGSVSMKLGNTFQIPLVARIGCDGKQAIVASHQSAGQAPDTGECANTDEATQGGEK